jgi:hypothetical protein
MKGIIFGKENPLPSLHISTLYFFILSYLVEICGMKGDPPKLRIPGRYRRYLPDSL